MEFLNWTALLAVLSPVLLFFKQFQTFLLKIFRIFWKNRIIPLNYKQEFYKKLQAVCYSIKLDDYLLDSSVLYSLSKGRYVNVMFKKYNLEILFYKKIVPILLFGAPNDTFKLQYFKYTFPFEKILQECVQESLNALDTQEETYFSVFERRGTSYKKLGKLASSDTSVSPGGSYLSPKPELSIFPYPGELLGANLPFFVGFDTQDLRASSPQELSTFQFTTKGKYVLEQVNSWLDARKWYDERGIVWKRSVLLNGKPGNGKSSLILEIARALQLSIYLFDLSSMDNEEFGVFLGELSLKPAIILFEDLDSVFNKRENITKNQQSGGLTFDYFINKLDGVKSIVNKFVFITTNHLEHLDSAILRPGRVDEIIHIESLSPSEKVIMAKNILKDYEYLIGDVVKDGENDSTAEFQNRCIKLALEKFWDKKVVKV